MNAPRDPFARYLDRLRDLGFRPSSARGQNFLLDPTLHRWIAAAADPGPADLALEVGVGLGFLTRELAALAGRVVGVEIDERLLGIARTDLHGLDNVELVLADALGGPDGGLAPATTAAIERSMPVAGAFLVVANLPYSASGPLLSELACMRRAPDRIVVLVQRELGERLAAVPGSKAFGGLSAQLQASYTVQRLRTVPAEVFRPRPKVASAVLRLELRQATGLGDAAARRSFRTFVRALFGHKRKVLRTTLAGAAAAVGGRLPELPGEFLQRRAETVPADELVGLWRRIAPGPGPTGAGPTGAGPGPPAGSARPASP